MALSKIRRAGAKAGKAASKAARTKNQPARESGERVKTTKQVKEDIERLKNQEAAKTTQKKGSIAKKMTVSKEDIKQATTARELDSVQRRIDNMKDGLIKKSMQAMLDRQRAGFEKMQADEVDAASRKSAQSASDRKEFKGYKPENPFEGMKKGGMAKKRKNYNKGGYANCGASMKPNGKSRK
jgi:hypothetical protein